MLNISKYLEKFKKNIDKGEYLNDNVVSIIKNHTNIEIDKNNIDIKSNIIYINTSPSCKNKIFIFKESILSEINTISSIKFVDIR